MKSGSLMGELRNIAPGSSSAMNAAAFERELDAAAIATLDAAIAKLDE